MTLGEAIKHCEEVAHEKRIESGECISVNDLENAEACYECCEDHKQLAEWLTELKQRREAEITTSPKSNADIIRKMTDEELAVFMVVQVLMGAASANGISDRQLAEDIVKEVIKSKSAEIDIENAKDWLKQEVKTDD